MCPSATTNLPCRSARGGDGTPQPHGRGEGSSGGARPSRGLARRRRRNGSIARLLEEAMSPRRRLEGDEGPAYGPRSSYFSVEIKHGGYFVGSGCNLSYVDGHSIWYDNVDCVTWSPLMLERVVEEIGYEMAGRMKVHYCVPMLTLDRNGLREIRGEDDTQAMTKFVDIGYKSLVLYLDHDESLTGGNLDDVVHSPVAELPAVISPMKAPQADVSVPVPVAEVAQDNAVVGDAVPVPMQVVYPVSDADSAARSNENSASTELEAQSHVDNPEEDGEAKTDSEDSDYDPKELDDSDYAVSEDDDDVFEANVDDDRTANKGKEKIKDDWSDGEDLWGPESDEEAGAMNAQFKTFREVDLQDPHFHVGQLFDSVELLRKAIRAYSCINRQDIKLPVNNKRKLCATCEDCTWYMWASQDSRSKCFMIKKFNGEHSCSKTYNVHSFTSVFLNKYILEARELSVLSMLEKIKSQIMARHYTKQKEEAKWTGLICPKIRKKVEKNMELANNCFADGAGDGLFAVGEVLSSIPVDYVVDIKHKTCTCKRWEKSGIPCPHAISCLRGERLDPMTFVDKCYSIEMHSKAYANIVYPCKDRSEWERLNGPTILPPSYKKHVGRPTKTRRKAPGEVDCRGGGRRMTRHGVIMHCGYCGGPKHNKNGCYFLKNGLPPPPVPPQTNGPVPTEETRTNVPPGPTDGRENQEIHPEIVLTQGNDQENQAPYEDTLVGSMSQQVPVVRNREAVEMPHSSFISAAQQHVNQPGPSSNTIRQGQLAQQLLAMQQEKNRVLEEKKIAVLKAKYAANLKKSEEAAARKALQEEKKAQLAQARALEAAAKKQKRKEQAELKKQAQIETRKFIADVKKSLAEKRKREAEEKKAAEKKLKAEARAAEIAGKIAATRPGSSIQDDEEASIIPRKKISMFDELRAPRKK